MNFRTGAMYLCSFSTNTDGLRLFYFQDRQAKAGRKDHNRSNGMTEQWTSDPRQEYKKDNGRKLKTTDDRQNKTARIIQLD